MTVIAHIIVLTMSVLKKKKISPTTILKKF